MATTSKLEILKEQIRRMPASKKKGDAIFDALELWFPLQEKEDWLRLINEKTGKLNQREIAAELCATDNIWKRERFRTLLNQMNVLVKESGLVGSVSPEFDNENQKGNFVAFRQTVTAESNPLKDLADMRLKTKLQQTEGKLHQANIRIKKLENELQKYTDLSELNRAIQQLMKPRK
ncbi:MULTISPECIES: hypothetical protein [unclassified Pseudoalteromonas]|uniref:hypothetical protein n=1 Tax=unclassified Pseudoalteromonas TaxID=194690 RepID=UPI0005A70E1F|nr:MULTISPECIES: hypothetical protein [unclassified Pseudoalteromonas]